MLERAQTKQHCELRFPAHVLTEKIMVDLQFPFRLDDLIANRTLCSSINVSPSHPIIQIYIQLRNNSFIGRECHSSPGGLQVLWDLTSLLSLLIKRLPVMVKPRRVISIHNYTAAQIYETFVGRNLKSIGLVWAGFELTFGDNVWSKWFCGPLCYVLLVKLSHAGWGQIFN